MSERSYPDISDILARKAGGRRAQARLSVPEKLATLNRLREFSEQMKQARLARAAQPMPSDRPKD